MSIDEAHFRYLTARPVLTDAGWSLSLIGFSASVSLDLMLFSVVSVLSLPTFSFFQAVDVNSGVENAESVQPRCVPDIFFSPCSKLGTVLYVCLVFICSPCCLGLTMPPT